MAAVEHMKEGERGVLGDGGLLSWIHEVPSGAKVGIGDVERRIERLKGGESKETMRGFVGRVDGLIT